MALKGDRLIIETDITQTCQSVASMGQVLTYKTAGSGAAEGDQRGQCQLTSGSPSGLKVAGLLMNDFITLDETQFHRNFQKDQHVVGEPCTLLRKGWVTTDQITGTPTVGDTAYLTSAGVLTPTVSSTGGVAATPKVGEFKSGKDEAGFVKVDIHLPA